MLHTHLPEVVAMEVEGVLLPAIPVRSQGRSRGIFPTHETSPVILDHDLHNLPRLHRQDVGAGGWGVELDEHICIAGAGINHLGERQTGKQIDRR